MKTIREFCIMAGLFICTVGALAGLKGVLDRHRPHESSPEKIEFVCFRKSVLTAHGMTDDEIQSLIEEGKDE